jgi:hypothetical protein
MTEKEENQKKGIKSMLSKFFKKSKSGSCCDIKIIPKEEKEEPQKNKHQNV